MKKISILSLHLGYGGIEKSVASLANALADSYEVSIITTYKLDQKPAFFLDNRIKIKYLITKYKPNKSEWLSSLKEFRFLTFIKESYKSIVTLILKRRTMIKAIKESDSDIIIATREKFNYYLGKYGRKDVFKVSWEHDHYDATKDHGKKVISSVKKIDVLVLVSNFLKEYYEERLKNSNCKCIYIPNMIDEIPSSRSSLGVKRLVTVGRLSKEKGMDDLLKVFKIIHEKEPLWQLDIVGDGSERSSLEEYIVKNNLSKCVTMHGFKNKDFINKLFVKSSIYLMTSKRESFGIVLIEAMSYHIPCIAFSDATGATELIKDDFNGYLIDNRDINSYASKVISLIKDKKKREVMGSNAYDISLLYTKDNVKNKWIDLLEKRGK